MLQESVNQGALKVAEKFKSTGVIFMPHLPVTEPELVAVVLQMPQLKR